MNSRRFLVRLRGSVSTPVVLLVWCITAHSQASSPSPPPEPLQKPTPSLEKQFFQNIWKDQVEIWTSPFRISKSDAKFLVPIGLTTVALIATDRESANALGENVGTERRKVSHGISRLGAAYTTGSIAGAFYLVGVAKHDARARETGILAAEAIVNAEIVTTVLKIVTQRPRPRVGDPEDDFFDGGQSFPSGHATNAWALATVVAYEYKHRKAVQFVAYGLATAVSLARYTSGEHFLSDVFVGSVIGYGVGRYVYKKRHVNDGTKIKGTVKHKWIPFVAPIYSGRDRTFGVVLAWKN